MEQLGLIFTASFNSLHRAVDLINDGLSLMAKLARVAIYPLQKVLQLGTAAIKGTLGLISTLASGVTSIVRGIVSTITSVLSTLIGIVTSIFRRIYDTAKNTFMALNEEWLTFTKEADRTFGLIVNEADASFQQVKDIGIKTVADIGKPLIGVMDAIFEVTSAGFRNVADAARVVEGASSLALAGWTDMNEVIGTLITTLNAFGMAADKANYAASVLFQTQVRGRGTMQQFAWLLANILPIAAAVGYGLEDAARATAAVTKTMGQHGRVMFSVVAMLRSMIEPTHATTAAWEKYGYQIVKTKDGQLDWVKSMERLREIFKKFGPEAIREMFRHQAALRGVSVVVNMAEKDFKELTAAFDDPIKLMKHLDDAVEQTNMRLPRIIEYWTVQFEVLGVAVMDMVYNAFRPAINDLLNIADNARDSFEKLTDESLWQGLSDVLNKLVTQFRESELWRDILSGIRWLIEQVYNWTAALVDKTEEFARSNLLLITLNHTYRIIKEGVKEWWEWLKEVANTVNGELVEAWNNWTAAFNAVTDAATRFFEKANFSSWTESVDSFGKRIWEIAKTDFPALIQSIQEVDLNAVIAGWLEKIATFAYALQNAILSFKDTLHTVYPVVQRIFDLWLTFAYSFADTMVRLVGLIGGVSALWARLEASKVAVERNTAETQARMYKRTLDQGVDKGGRRLKPEARATLQAKYEEATARYKAKGDEWAKLEQAYDLAYKQQELFWSGMPKEIDDAYAAAKKRLTEGNYELPTVVGGSFDKAAEGAMAAGDALLRLANIIDTGRTTSPTQGGTPSAKLDDALQVVAGTMGISAGGSPFAGFLAGQEQMVGASVAKFGLGGPAMTSGKSSPGVGIPGMLPTTAMALNVAAQQAQGLAGTGVSSGPDMGGFSMGLRRKLYQASALPESPFTKWEANRGEGGASAFDQWKANRSEGGASAFDQWKTNRDQKEAEERGKAVHDAVEEYLAKQQATADRQAGLTEESNRKLEEIARQKPTVVSAPPL